MKRTAVSFVALVIFQASLTFAADFRFSPRPNNAHLIQWRAWSPEAFEEARKENRLILLSLSAVWCHWCHVMDETTYSDAAVINYINEHFIPIRVDADRRPDIDSYYNQGGWPSTVILTPQGEVLSGGNYIPPEEMLGRLRRISALFTNDHGAIQARIEEVKAMKNREGRGQEDFAGAPDKSILDNIVQLLKHSFDERNGGFGRGQKFPSPDSIDFLLSVYAKNNDEEIKRIVTLTLDREAEGELFDKIGGGFFRYATRPDWSEPHYEKMLDVNAGMIKNFAEASLVFHNKEYLRVMRETVRYVQAHLYDAASGVFFNSQDADEAYYEKKDRKGMAAPFVDRTAYADSSSLMISALVASYGATADAHYLDMARRNADFILTKLYTPSDGVFHSFRDNAPHLKGVLSDNALAGLALLDLYNTTGEKKYLDAAQAIGRQIVDTFYDADRRRFRAFLDTSPKKPVTAGVLSTVNENLANFRAISFLGRLAYTGGDKKQMEARDAVAAALSRVYERFAPQAAVYGSALLWVVGEPVQITILADENGARKYQAEVNRIFIPEKVVRVLSLSRDREEIIKLTYAIKESVYLCAGKRCSAPISDPERLGVELRDFAGKAVMR